MQPQHSSASRDEVYEISGLAKRCSINFVDQLGTQFAAEDLLSIDESLTRLGQVNPSKAELVRLRFYAGMSVPEAAKILDISVATAERYWAYARSWLYCELSPGEESQ